MKRFTLFLLLLLTTICFTRAQNVFDPDDPIVRYKSSAPLGSREHPDSSIRGLQKWVSTPTIGVSTGTSTFDASSFKQYFINLNGYSVAFRIKFPRSYRENADKKYPVNIFLHGGGEVGCPTNGGVYNNEKQLWLGGELFRDRVDNNQFDGFLVYPQMLVTTGCFAGWATAPSGVYASIVAMVDSMAKYVRADVDRVLVDGLSGGGYGAWKFAELFPQRIAKIMPSAAAPNVTSSRTRFVHIPIWFATGGKDLDPSPTQALNAYNRMLEIGANIRYTVYPERGHSVWYQHWREPDFVPAMNDVHKANPLVFFQRSEFCRESDVDAKLGLTPGFYAYEWQRNGVTIGTSQNNTHTILDSEPIIAFTGNEITVRLFGTYRARFKRTASSPWSDWSLKPVEIKTKSTTQTLPIEVDGARSRVLPALDGSTTVPLTLAPGFTNYQWYTSTDSLVATTQVFNAPVGVYKGRYEEQYGCGTAFSPDFTVVDANGTPKPAAAANLTAVPVSQRSIRLNWTQGSGETGIEVYRATQTGGPFTFVRLMNANATTYTDTGLVKDQLYYYRVRAVSGTGAAEGSNEATAKTLVDNEPPTPPSGLAYTVSSTTAVRLTWRLSTDNDRVERYDIYVNGRKLYSAFESGFVVQRLDQPIPYTFVIRAVDAAGNVSQPSNQVTWRPEGVPETGMPGTPSEISSEAISYNQITITWADTISNERGFELVRSTTSSGTFVPVGTAGANHTSFTDSGLNAQTRYYYRVRAINDNGESGFSERTNATTLAKPNTPEAPPQLTGEAAANGSVSLVWKDESDNETGYRVFKSTDSVNFTQVKSLPANSNAFTDTETETLATYYYYVLNVNSAGDGKKSNVVRVRAGNNAPVISGLDNVFVRGGTTADEPFTVSDDVGETVTVTIQNNPGFVTLVNSGNNNYLLRISPGTESNGTYSLFVTARDNNNKSTIDTAVITVGDQNTRSILINFGNTNSPALSPPWNNWLGVPRDGAILHGAKDETNTPTAITITAVTGWSGNTSLGHITGDNSGIVPDAVLKSGWSDSGAANIIKISGLVTTRQYNLSFIGSQNEGYDAEATFTTGNQTATLNARYNTTRAANLNSLIPDANGEVTVTITQSATSPAMYLNGLVIQEYEQSIQMLNPDHLYAEVLDRSRIRLTWSDRTNNESGYELVRATDSLFTQAVEVINLPANSNEYTNTGLNADTKYWYRVRAKSGANYSEYSKRVSANTPAIIVYVNFNVTVEDAPSPWNNLVSPPLSNFTTPDLKDHSGKTTDMQLTLEREFNGEFTAGVNTGNNSGVVPDNVLRANFWLDKTQLSQFRLSGLSHGKRYRIGFIGSSSTPDWFKGDYTATYTIHNRTVYLNSWMNSSKIVYIDNVAPDADGKLMLNFSTTEEAGYGFNAGIIIHEYSFVPPVDTTTNPPDTIPGGNEPPPVDTIPGGNEPPPVDTIPGGNEPPPVDTIPGGNEPPPVDTIPGGNEPPPVDTLPGGNNPPPVDTLPGGNNPPPVDSLPGNNPPPVDSLPENQDKVIGYPNPFISTVQLGFYNKAATDRISVYIYDSYGKLIQRQDFGTRAVGPNVLVLGGYMATLKSGVYLATLKVNGATVRSVKLIKARY